MEIVLNQQVYCHGRSPYTPGETAKASCQLNILQGTRMVVLPRCWYRWV